MKRRTAKKWIVYKGYEFLEWCSKDLFCIALHTDDSMMGIYMMFALTFLKPIHMFLKYMGCRIACTVKIETEMAQIAQFEWKINDDTDIYVY